MLSASCGKQLQQENYLWVDLHSVSNCTASSLPIGNKNCLGSGVSVRALTTHWIQNNNDTLFLCCTWRVFAWSVSRHELHLRPQRLVRAPFFLKMCLYRCKLKIVWCDAKKKKFMCIGTGISKTLSQYHRKIPWKWGSCELFHQL